MLGVFLALDFFLFYVFWEVMLLPMYFLIGVWGGPRREYAAIKFFLYTLVGSVLMLIAILLLYFNSDLRALARVSDFAGPSKSASVSWQGLHISPEEQDAILHVAPVDTAPAGRPHASIRLTRSGAHAWRLISVSFESAEEGTPGVGASGAGSSPGTTAIYDEPTQTIAVLLQPGASTAADVVAAINANPLVGGKLSAELAPGSDGTGAVLPSDSIDFTRADGQVHTFNMLALMAIGQHTGCFSRTLQVWCFVLLFIGFAIKIPSVPLHTWLPDAHVEAPTPISMILAGVLLKMGGYGIIRICYPMCPFGGLDLAFWVCLVGVVSMIYGAFAAMAQRDFKRLVAYSSVSHMGYVVLGLGVWSAQGWTGYQSQYWSMGVQGAMFQMIGHGISSAGMFFMVGVIYDRVHHRNLNEFGALFGKMPVYTALSIGIFFAALGLPGLCGFVGEVLVVFATLKYSTVLAVLAASVVIITAAYILWTLQRVYLGPRYQGPHEEDITPMTPREFSIAAPLFVLAIVLGVLPYQTMLRYITPTADRQVQELAEWTQRQTANGAAGATETYAQADAVESPERETASGVAADGEDSETNAVATNDDNPINDDALTKDVFLTNDNAKRIRP
jgi:NADH-quinone oxidoreductase subunit M